MAQARSTQPYLPVDTLASAWAAEVQADPAVLCSELVCAALAGMFDALQDGESITTGVLYCDRYGQVRQKTGRLLVTLFEVLASTEEPRRYEAEIRPQLDMLAQRSWAKGRPEMAQLVAGRVHNILLTRAAAHHYAGLAGAEPPAFWHAPPEKGGLRVSAASVQDFLMRYADGRKSEAECRAAAEDYFGIGTLPERSVWRPAWSALAPNRKPLTETARRGMGIRSARSLPAREAGMSGGRRGLGIAGPARTGSARQPR